MTVWFACNINNYYIHINILDVQSQEYDCWYNKNYQNMQSLGFWPACDLKIIHKSDLCQSMYMKI